MTSSRISGQRQLVIYCTGKKCNTGLKGKSVLYLLCYLMLFRLLPTFVFIIDYTDHLISSALQSSVSDILRLRGADSLTLNHPDTPSAHPLSHTSTSPAPSADPSASHWNDIFDNLSF